MTSLVFFGNERLVSGLKQTNVPVLTGLIERGYDIKAVVSHHSDSRSRNNRPLEVAEIAAAHGIPVFLPEKPAEIIEELKSFEAEAAVLVAYGKIISQSVIDVFPKGIINLHPSLLPRWRGPTPIESTIISGDKTAGISIMQLVTAMDAGPVYAKASVELTGTEDKFELYEKLARVGTELMLDNLPVILDGSLRPIAQDESKATYCQLLSKHDGLLDPSQLTADEAERRVRAYLGFPKTKLTIANQPVIITKVHTANDAKTPLDVAFHDGKYLSVDELVAPSGKVMSAEAFIHGYLK